MLDRSLSYAIRQMDERLKALTRVAERFEDKPEERERNMLSTTLEIFFEGCDAIRTHAERLGFNLPRDDDDEFQELAKGHHT